MPPPQAFIAKLRQKNAPRLQLVFLNGCETAELGYQIVTEMPYVMAICWATITEDAAARAFAQGFYDAAGSFLGLGEPVQAEMCISDGTSVAQDGTLILAPVLRLYLL